MGHVLDLVPEPHGDREVGEPVVARRPRERAELALRALLRHRLASGEGRAGRQGADPDPRRSVRRGARAAGAAARLSRRRVLRRATTTRRCRSRPTPSRRSSSATTRRDGSSGHAGGRRRRAAEHPDRRAATCRRAATAIREAIAVRAREKEIVKRRLAALDRDEPGRRGARSTTSVARLNGVAGQPRSFDRLDALLNAAVVPARALARRVGGDQLPALLRRQRARGAAHGRSGGLRRGAPVRVRAGAARRGDRASHRSRRRPVRAGRLPAPAAGSAAPAPTTADRFYIVVEKILGPGEQLPATGRCTARPATSSPPSSTACSSTAATSARSTTSTGASSANGATAVVRRSRLPLQEAGAARDDVGRHQLARAIS